MSMPNGTGPFDRLRDADPVRAHDVPDASLARISARIQEHLMTDVHSTTTTKPSRRPLALLGGLGLAGALALAIAIGLGPGLASGQPGSIGNVPTPTSDPAGGGGMASCLMYDPAILPTFDVVFDGTVTAIDGDRITFEVNAAWKGVGDSVTLTRPADAVALTGPLPDFEVGGRYLVTAAGTNINSCGYTLEFDAGTAASWAAAFGG